MRATTLLRYILDLKQTRVTGFDFSAVELRVDVAPSTRRARCGCCGRKCQACYDGRERQWQHLDFAGMKVVLRYRIRRVECPCCGVTTEMVPWAEPGSWFTRDFEDTVALLAQKTDKTTVCQLTGVAWRTVGNIVRRVVDRRGPADQLDGLSHIGIDEISYKRHHHYLTLVTDHLSGHVVWVGVGRNAETLGEFFDQLGPERAARLQVVSVDMAQAYIDTVTKRAPNAKIVFDRFHVQRLAHDALDEVRREQMRELRGTDEASAIKKTRWALQKNPWNLSVPEHEKLATVQSTNRPLYRAYLLKETLCSVLDGRQPNVAKGKLEEWIAWATRSRLEPFRKVARTIQRYLDGIVEYVRTKLSNALSEGTNSKVRVITKRSYGFHDPLSLVAMIYLCCTGIGLRPVRHFPNVRQRPA
jgi:transposase